ncbi:MAG: hypothetical protein PVJ86_05555 [Phycisphaerales bacterium]
MDKSEFLIESPGRKLLLGILALVFLLTTPLSEATSSQADEASKQKMLRQAAQGWIQVGIEQYQRDLFEDATQSFRRARVYRKYLTAAERTQLKEFLAKARTARPGRKQVLTGTQTVSESVEEGRLAKAGPRVEKVKGSESLGEEGREQIGERPRRISGQASEQKEQTDQMAEPVVIKEQAKEVSSPHVTVVKVESLMGRFTRYSWWLYGRQRVLLMIGAALVVLLLILVARRQRAKLARTIYAHPVGEHPPTIGIKLAGRKQNRQGTEDLGKRAV